MSINMTEHFEFQNDNDKSLKLMLQAICPILFGDGKETKYSQLWLRVKQSPTFWNDGSEYKEHHSEPLVLYNKETDWYVLAHPKRIYGGAKVGEYGREFTTLEAATKHAYDNFGSIKTPPTRMWIATIGDYKDAMQPDDITGTMEELINQAHGTLVNARETRREEFEKLCGDGYNSFFNHDDGHVGIAYHVYSTHTTWEELHLALTHAYYGK